MTPALVNEIITLKTVSKLSPAEIARRCGIHIADVGDVLIDAGLLVLTPAAKFLREESLRDSRPWRQSVAPRAIAPTSDDNPDLDHCLRVIRALGGRGFPFLEIAAPAT